MKDEAGRWRSVALPEARTRKRAEDLDVDLAYKRRRQREGLDPLPADPRLTVGVLLRWWLDTDVADSTSEGRSATASASISKRPTLWRCGCPWRALEQAAAFDLSKVAKSDGSGLTRVWKDVCGPLTCKGLREDDFSSGR